MVKFGLIFILFVLLIIGINNLNQSDIDGPFRSSSNVYKCSKSKDCTYNIAEGIYSCIYFNEDDGVEEYITCDSNTNNKKIDITTTVKDTSKDDEDYDDTFDYDREDIMPSED